MKKKALTTIVAFILALTLFATGAYAGAQYILWNGTDDYHSTIENLNLIEQGIGRKDTEIRELNAELSGAQTELEGVNREIEQMSNQLLDKDNKINSLEQDKAALEKRIQELEKRIADGQTTRGQLEQAEKDMKGVRERSDEVLNEFN